MTTTLIPYQPGSSACLENLFFNHPAKKMAIDTIKVSEGPSPFPFPQPHNTNNKTPPKTLILEIIFSSDDTNTTNIGNEEVDEDEDAADADDDVDGHDNDSDDTEDEDEDDDEDVDVEDDASSSQDEDESEEEEEDEDDDDQEEDYDEEHDEGNLNFDHGGFDSDDDLIVDFGHDDEELLVEFEDLSVENKSPPPSIPSKPPTPKANPIPFWFTNEEPDQIRMIFDSYAITLDIEEQRKACIRSPAPFIGRIIRMPLKPSDNEAENCDINNNTNNNNNNNNNNTTSTTTFKTLDKVEVYVRELYPLGTILPLSRVVWLLTTWDSNEGIPTNSVEVTKGLKKSLQKRALTTQSSTLYCAPIFRTKDDYQYTVSSPSSSSSSSSFESSSSSFPAPLMYASTSSTNLSISRISPFLPEHCRVISFSFDS